MARMSRSKSTERRLAAALCESWLGSAAQAAVDAASGRSLRVLTYHRVRDHRAGVADDLTEVERGVSLDVFDHQMQTLRTRFNLVGLDLVEAWLRSEAKLPARATLVTFDDGYRDLFDNALPILKKYSVPAVVFLPTGFVGTSRLFWWDALAISLRSLSRPLDGERWIDEECSLIAARALRRVPLVGGTEKASQIETVTDELKDLAPGRVAALVEALWELAGSPRQDVGTYATLSWDQVREMAESGISFGSHTADHVILTAVDLEEAEREIRDSRRTIESELKRPVTAFCYPSGAYSDGVKLAVSRSGFVCAFCTTAGINRRDADPFSLRRIGADATTGTSFEARLLDGYHQLRGLLRRH